MFCDLSTKDGDVAYESMRNVHVDNDFIGLFVVLFLISLVTHDKGNDGSYICVSIENGVMGYQLAW